MVVNLTNVSDYIWLFVVAAGCGAIGGLAYELLLVRRGESGTLEMPGRRPTNSFIDLGFFASVLLGAVAAVAISYFFTPEVLVKVHQGNVDVIRTQWQIVKVVPLSLIVGSAGGAFLSAMQARTLTQVAEQKVAAVNAAGKAAVAHVAAAGRASAGRAATAVAESVRPAVANAVDAIPSDFADTLQQLVGDNVYGQAGMIQAFGRHPVVETDEWLETARAGLVDIVEGAIRAAQVEIDGHLEVAQKNIDLATD